MKKFILIPLFTTILGLFGCKAQTSNPTDTMKDSFPVQKTEAEWQALLTPEQYYILRQKGTERPHTSPYNLHWEAGTYTCGGCNAPLFKSDTKFDAHCGWPSFDRALSDSTVVEKIDLSYGMRRVEILCGSCGGHLGHVFDDGPTETGMRYCINGAALKFEEEEEK